MTEESGHMSTAIVVGGGIIGLSCAIRLRQRGFRVVVIDEARPVKPASWGNAGHIAVEQVTPLATLDVIRSAPRRLFGLTGGPLDIGWRYVGTWLPWCLRYLRASLPLRAARGHVALRAALAQAMPEWRAMVADLQAPDLLIENGHLMVWGEGHDPSAAMRTVMESDLGTASARLMDSAELAGVATRMGVRPLSGLVFSGTAQVRSPGALLETMQARLAADSDCHRREQRVTRVASASGGVQVTLQDGSALKGDKVILAAGVRTSGLVPEWRPPLIAERGYHIEWDHGGIPEGPPVVFADRSVIVSMFGTRMRASTFVEFTHADAPPDIRKWEWLEKTVEKAGLPVRSGFSRWVGCRPTLPDYLPAIGPVPGLPGVIAACGHQHLGLTLAPLTARIVSAIAAGDAVPDVARPFCPNRF